MARKPGTLVRAKCCICGTIELSTGAGNHSRCTPCKKAGFRPVKSRRSRYDVTGKEEAGCEVQRAIRDGRLSRASEHKCADCGKQATDYDHRDYNHPLVVAPVCRGCNLRRGPAVPQRDWIARAQSWGYAPYRLKSRARRVFDLLGISTAPLEPFPARLTLDDWRLIWPELINTEGAPAIPSAEGVANA